MLQNPVHDGKDDLLMDPEQTREEALTAVFDEEDRKVKRMTEVADFVRDTPEFKAYKREVNAALDATHLKHWGVNPQGAINVHVKEACEAECKAVVAAIDARFFATHASTSSGSIRIGDAPSGNQEQPLKKKLIHASEQVAKMVVAHDLQLGSLEFGRVVGYAVDEFMIDMDTDMRENHGDTNWWPEVKMPSDWPEGAPFTPTIAEHFRPLALKTVVERVAEFADKLRLSGGMDEADVPAIPPPAMFDGVDEPTDRVQQFFHNAERDLDIFNQLAPEPLDLGEPDTYAHWEDDDDIQEMLAESVAMLMHMADEHDEGLEEDLVTSMIDNSVKVALAIQHDRAQAAPAGFCKDVPMEDAELLRSYVIAMIEGCIMDDDEDEFTGRPHHQ